MFLHTLWPNLSYYENILQSCPSSVKSSTFDTRLPRNLLTQPTQGFPREPPLLWFLQLSLKAITTFLPPKKSILTKFSEFNLALLAFFFVLYYFFWFSCPRFNSQLFLTSFTFNPSVLRNLNMATSGILISSRIPAAKVCQTTKQDMKCFPCFILRPRHLLL